MAATALKPKFSASNGSDKGPSFAKMVVYGAGPMGAGFAALGANAGMDVVLLDLEQKKADEAVERLRKGSGSLEKKKSDPLNAGLHLPQFADRITTGSSKTDMYLLADADIIIEAATERPEFKVGIFKQALRHCKYGAQIVTNTSSIPLESLLDAFDEDDRRIAREQDVNFAGLHGFNPLWAPPLIEIIPAQSSRPEKTESLLGFSEHQLGKSPQICKDNPGFLANPVGAYTIKLILNFALEHGMRIEDVDAVLGLNASLGTSGPCAVADLVGLDISRSVVQSLRDAMPGHPRVSEEAARMFTEAAYDLPFLDAMIEQGLLGRKTESGAGLHRILKIENENGKVIEKIKQVYDIPTGEYRDAEECKLDSAKAGRRSLREVVETDDIGGRLAWHVLKNMMVYTAHLAPGIATGIDQMDTAMRDGYLWKRGPFQLIDALGDDHETGMAYLTRRLEEEGVEIPPLFRTAAGCDFYRTENNVKQVMGFDGVYRDLPKKPGVLDLDDIKAIRDPLATNEYATLHDIGDGVICAELHGPGNSLGPDTMDMLNRAADLIEGSEGKYKALVIHTPKGNFAVGANLALVLIMANTLHPEEIDDALYKGQMTLDRLQHASFPVVASVSGAAVGGGAETAMHADCVVADGESYIGLVEIGVGVVPAWGGCKEKLRRHIARAKADEASCDSPEMEVFTQIATAKMSASAAHAQELGFLSPHDKIVRNRSYLLAEAKRVALEMVQGYQPPERVTFRLGGPGLKAVMDMGAAGSLKAGQATWGDIVPLKMLAHVLSGGNTTPDQELTEFDILRLEREAFMTAVMFELERDLLMVPIMPALERMRYMLDEKRAYREEKLDITAAELRAMIRPYNIKDRPDYNPYIPGSAPEEAAQAVQNGIDLKTMSGSEMVDHMVHVLETDNWKPVPSSAHLTDMYNRAASDRRNYLIQKLSGLKVVATIKGRDGVLAATEEFLNARTKKVEGYIVTGKGDPDERRAELEVYRYYKGVITDIRRSLN